MGNGCIEAQSVAEFHFMKVIAMTMEYSCPENKLTPAQDEKR
jgi:hypothetical protein